MNNLVRAVAPPYPGAFCDDFDTRFVVARARVVEPLSPVQGKTGSIIKLGESFGILCGDGKLLEPLALVVHDQTLNRDETRLWLGQQASVKQ